MACLIRDEVAAYGVRATDVVSSHPGSLELGLQSILELLRAFERGGGVCTANPENQERLLPLHMSLVAIDMRVNQV